jgi:hypothetical protein
MENNITFTSIMMDTHKVQCNGSGMHYHLHGKLHDLSQVILRVLLFAETKAKGVGVFTSPTIG